MLKISIVMLSVGVEKYLLQAASSVLQYEGAELILVDPKNSIQVKAIIDTLNTVYNHRIIHVTTDDNSPSEGLNNGVSQATGDILGILNGDDFYLPGALNIVESFFADDSELVVLHGAGIIVNESTHRTNFVYPFGHSLVVLRRFNFGSINYFHPGEFVRLNTKHDREFNEMNRSNWDLERYIGIRLSNPKIASTNIKLAVFRVHEDSLTGSGKYRNELKFNQENIAKFFPNTFWRILNPAFGKFWRGIKYLRGLMITLFYESKRTRL